MPNPEAGLPGPDISVVLPIFSKDGHHPGPLRPLREEAGRRGMDLEAVVVDDGSPAPVSAPEWARVIRFDANRGKAAAVWAGVSAARGEVIVVYDADLPFGIKPVFAIAELCSGDAPVAIGQRTAPSGKRWRNLLHWAAQRWVYPAGVDSQCGLKAYHRTVAKEIADRTVWAGGFGHDLLLFEVLRNRRLPYRTLQVTPDPAVGERSSTFKPAHLRELWKLIRWLRRRRLAAGG